MRKFAEQIIEAWKVGKKKSSGRCYTNGTTVFAYATPVATKALNGRRYIVASVSGGSGTHLVNCLWLAFPRAIAIARIDLDKIYEPTVHYPPRRAAHRIRIGKPVAK